MTARERGGPAGRAHEHASPFQRLRRARRRLGIASLLVVLVEVMLHDGIARSFGARLLWLAAVAASLAIAGHGLLAFRCPSCAGTFLATGGWRDFLGLARIFWSTRCGVCAVSIKEEEPPSSGDLADSRPT